MSNHTVLQKLTNVSGVLTASIIRLMMAFMMEMELADGGFLQLL
jgi:hypothetical protein